MKTWSAIVLSGGTNKRFGSDKSVALLHGLTLLENVLTFIPKEVKTVIVGKDVFEEPPLGGPVAGIARGLQEPVSAATPTPKKVRNRTKNSNLMSRLEERWQQRRDSGL